MLKIYSYEDLKDLIINITDINKTINKQLTVPIPLNLYIHGSPGIGKTTSVLNILETARIPYTFFAATEEVLPSNLVGPIDVPRLVLKNELTRRVEEGIFAPNTQVSVIDEIDVLPSGVISALKSFLTAPKVATPEGTVDNPKSLIIAVGNMSLDDLLENVRLPTSTAAAIRDRFPFRILYDPVPSYEEVYEHLKAVLNLGNNQFVVLDDQNIPIEIFIRVLIKVRLSLRSISQILCIRDFPQLLSDFLGTLKPKILSEVVYYKNLFKCEAFKAKAAKELSNLNNGPYYDELVSKGIPPELIPSIIKVKAREVYAELTKDGVPTSADVELDDQIKKILSEIKKLAGEV